MNPSYVPPLQDQRQILKWIAFHRCATVHQVLYRFFTALGQSSRRGEIAIKKLTDSGLVWSELLNPTQRSTSKRVLHLTRAGWLEIGARPPAGWDQPMTVAERDHRLQHAEVLMVRRLQGWRRARHTKAAELVRVWLNRNRRDQPRSARKQIAVERLEHVALSGLPLRVLAHCETSEIRFLLPVDGLMSGRLEEMSRFDLWPVVEFEVVSTGRDRQKIMDQIHGWGERADTGLAVYILASHSARRYGRPGAVPPDESGAAFFTYRWWG
jgi:hypothetical protein